MFKETLKGQHIPRTRRTEALTGPQKTPLTHGNGLGTELFCKLLLLEPRGEAQRESHDGVAQEQ